MRGNCFLIYSFLFFLFWGCSQKQSASEIAQKLAYLKDPEFVEEIEKLASERNEIYENHKKYIQNLKILKSRVQMIGDRLTKKIQIARNQEKNGNLYLENQLWELALANYEIGLAVYPEDAVLNYYAGLCYANLGLIYFDKAKEYWEQARKYYLLAIQYNPNYTLSYYGLSILFLSYFEKNVDKTLLAEGLKNINQYIAKNPQMPNGYFVRARIFYYLNQKHQAMENYKTILTLTKKGSQDFIQAEKNIKLLASEIEGK